MVSFIRLSNRFLLFKLFSTYYSCYFHSSRRTSAHKKVR